MPRADAHIHLFVPGYAWPYPDTCRRVQPDELTLYEVLAEQHHVERALVVCYEGEPWAEGNTQQVADLTRGKPRFRPLAWVGDPPSLSESQLEAWREQGYIGLSCYIFDDAFIGGLARAHDNVWRWLVRHRWLLSVNSRGDCWNAWRPILDRHPDLRVLVSHLGLPPARQDAASRAEAAEALGHVAALARYPGVHVKLSGFYAMTNPGWAYPYEAAWPYVEHLLVAFGPQRLLWGSDYSPSLAWMSFPQSFSLFAKMPFLSESDRRRIEGENLLRLLDESAQPHQLSPR